jgi:hypothetical protein
LEILLLLLQSSLGSCVPLKLFSIEVDILCGWNVTQSLLF